MVGSVCHKGYTLSKLVNGRGGLQPTVERVCGCSRDVFCRQLVASCEPAAPCGSYQRLFGLPDHGGDFLNLSPVWFLPFSKAYGPNNALKSY